MKNNIAFFLPTFQPLAMGGAETQAKRLAIKIIENGNKVIFITPGRRELPKYEIIDSIPVYRFLTIRETISKYWPYKNFIQSNQNICFDYTNRTKETLQYTTSLIGVKDVILMVDLFISSFFFFLKHRKKFKIVQVNTVTYIAPLVTLIAVLLRKKILIKDSTMDGLIKMHLTPFPILARKFLIKNSFFVSMTKEIYNNFLMCGVNDSKIFKIPNGIEITQIRKCVNTKSYNCLFVGNLYQQPAKGIDVLLLAWKEVSSLIPTAKLTIVGDGNIEAYKNYLKTIGIYERVTFEGKVNPNSYFESHDLFILPSRREGMSNALMEAMLNGLPVVATKISGSIDLVENGVNGYLVNVDMISELVDAIYKALTDMNLRHYCTLNNPEKIKNLCDIDIICNKYLNAYESII